MRTMRSRLFCCAVLGAFTFSALAGCGVRASASTHPTGGPDAADSHSGIRGRVLLGPTCPVERPGQRCVRPYRATIAIWSTAGRRLARVRADTNGRFTVMLRPGRYLLVPQNGRPYPRASQQGVTVRPGRYTTVLLRYDTGIR